MNRRVNHFSKIHLSCVAGRRGDFGPFLLFLNFLFSYYLFGVSDIWFVISTFTPIFFIEIAFVLPPPPWSDMRGCRGDWLGPACFAVINPLVLSANRVDLGFFVS